MITSVWRKIKQPTGVSIQGGLQSVYEYHDCKRLLSWICQKVLTIVKALRLTCLIWSSHTRSVQEPAISIYGIIEVLYGFILYPCNRIFGNLLETKRPGSKELDDPTVPLWVGPGLNWLHHHQAKQEEQHLAYEHWQVRNQQVAIKVFFFRFIHTSAASSKVRLTQVVTRIDFCIISETVPTLLLLSQIC